MVLKTVAYMSRWTISENFMEVKIFIWKFSVIEILRWELRVFAKTTSRVVKAIFSGARGTLSQQQFWSKSLNISDFPDYYWSFQDNIEKIYFRFDKIAKSVLRNKLRKKLFQEKKKLFYFFQDFGRCFFTISKKLLAGLSKPQSKYLCNVLRNNIFLLKNEHDINLLRTLRWKRKGLSVEKFGVHTTEIRASREIFWGKKYFSFEKVFFFCYHFSSCSDFFVFLQTSSVRCVKPPTNVRREKKIGEIKLEKLCASNIFGLWEEKTWSFSKTVKHDSQNRSLPEQMNNFRKFYGSKNIYLKVFGLWTETSDFLRKLLLKVAKGAIQVSSATFQKNMIKVKFTVCGFFRTLCDFFYSDRKSGTRCQNQKIGVQRKKVGRTFLSRMFFETFLDFEQKNLEI